MQSLSDENILQPSLVNSPVTCLSATGLHLGLFTPLRGRVRPHQAYKVSYVLLVLLLVVVVVLVVVVPGQIF